MGRGVEGFEFALRNARQQQTQLKAMRMEKELASNAERIRYLEGHIAQALASGAHAPLPTTTPALSNVGPSGSTSSAFCAGTITFNITFDYGMVDGAVTTHAEWSEFGPHAEMTRNIHTYAYAWTPDHSSYQEDSDSSGPIGGTCCYFQESFAAVGVTFSPKLYGSAYIVGTSGCNDMLFYEDSNY
ncbi:hypothetical protein [Corallococcus aberystwythensis]|nr:hypothetical protein [Corallococcus aberystwythensis]